MDNNNGQLSTLDKFKLLLGLKSLASQVTNGTQSTTLWQKLDGTKTILGLLMIIAYYALPSFGIKVPDIFLKIGIAWAGVGFMHKFDKATGLISAVATALVKTNDTINGDKK